VVYRCLTLHCFCERERERERKRERLCVCVSVVVCLIIRWLSHFFIQCTQGLLPSPFSHCYLYIFIPICISHFDIRMKRKTLENKIKCPPSRNHKHKTRSSGTTCFHITEYFSYPSSIFKPPKPPPPAHKQYSPYPSPTCKR